ncbi:MAG: hypothetical protein ACFFBR_11210, partial [Promethearchaeota archaeon]
MFENYWKSAFTEEDLGTLCGSGNNLLGILSSGINLMDSQSTIRNHLGYSGHQLGWFAVYSAWLQAKADFNSESFVLRYTVDAENLVSTFYKLFPDGRPMHRIAVMDASNDNVGAWQEVIDGVNYDSRKLCQTPTYPTVSFYTVELDFISHIPPN